MTYTQAHENAVRCARDFRTNEANLITAIQKVIRTRAWTYFDYSSLHCYAVEALRLSEDQAYQYTRVALKAMQVPELQKAIQKGELKISNARRILKVMTPETKTEWIEKATNLTQRELEKEVVKVNPQEAVRDRIKPIAQDLSELRMSIPKDVEEMITRIKDLESQRTRKPAELIDVLRQSFLAYLKQNDPFLKARRNIDKPTKQVSVSRQTGRTVIPANVRHEVRIRDQDQCVYKDNQGRRCPNRRWLEVHHVIPVSQGGRNTVENLVTLCHPHHKFQHQWGVMERIRA